MRTIVLAEPDNFDEWRAAAKSAVMDQVAPHDIVFDVMSQQLSLLDTMAPPTQSPKGAQKPHQPGAPWVPKDFIALAKLITCHSSPERFALLYRLLVRLQKDKTLLNHKADREVHIANALANEVSRDVHKMKAFVRFRKTGEAPGGLERFVAWFEPSHNIVRITAPFFMRRFTGMQWSILTPRRCAHWDGRELNFSPAMSKSDAPSEDALEDYWRTYYASIFNPARLKIDAMTSEMPKKYWKNLPEAKLIPELIGRAGSREHSMLTTEPTVPRPAMMVHREISPATETIDLQNLTSLDQLHKGIHACRGCPLWRPATQAVPGVGSCSSRVMFVGEQPGDMEDLRGEPFVGPAGQLLRSITSEIGLQDVYLTNAVKHFKFAPRGKRRLHKSPTAGEIDRCSWWLKQEVRLVKPRVIVALGVSAVRALTGKSRAIGKVRGKPIRLSSSSTLIITRHPASILRLSTRSEKQTARQELAADLLLGKAVSEAGNEQAII